MIILDTNVISEPLKPAPSPAVIAWLNAQDPATLHTTTINLAELYAGVAVLEKGKRRTTLMSTIRTTMSRLFGSRVLSFDVAAAESYASIAERAKDAGHKVPHVDALIAAIAAASDFAVATRNVADFAGTGVRVINPWDHRPTPPA